MAVVAAALAAEGQSTVLEIETVERGYEDLVGRLTSLGADVVERRGLTSALKFDTGWNPEREHAVGDALVLAKVRETERTDRALVVKDVETHQPKGGSIDRERDLLVVRLWRARRECEPPFAGGWFGAILAVKSRVMSPRPVSRSNAVDV